MTRAATLITGLTLFSVMWIAAPAAFGITQDEAVSLASDFARRVGWDTKHPFEAVFPGWPTRTSVWRVSADEVEVLLDDVTSRIVKVANGAITARMAARGEAVTAISQDQAEQAAYRYLDMLAVPPGAELESVSLERLAAQDPSSTVWKALWRRTHNGFKFSRTDDATVLLDPADGSLYLVAVNWVSPLPESTRLVLTDEQAIAQARAYLTDLGFQAGSLVSTRVEIVQSNDYWEWYDLNAASSGPTCSRLAWRVEFDAPWERTEVWVDTESALVLGGLHSRSIPNSPVKLRRPALASAKDILITAPDLLARPVRISTGTDEGQRLLSAVAHLPRADAAPCHLPISLRFEGKDHAYLLGYSPTDHLLVLREKTYRGATFKANLAWQTSQEFEDLLAACMAGLAFSEGGNESP